MRRLVGCIDRGLDAVTFVQEEVQEMTLSIRTIAECLDPKHGSKEDREEKFENIRLDFARDQSHPWKAHAAMVMESFSPGLFVGSEIKDLPRENGDLERWFRLPKSHERHIHGRRHAGVRIVLEGPTLIPVLDAHASHPEPFHTTDLLPYRNSPTPQAQTQALHRRAIMRRARSKKKRGELLRDLESRYCNSR